MSIKESVKRYIRDGESLSQGLGLEIEHFVINDAGVQIEFHEVSSILEKMAGIVNAEIIYMDGYPVGYVTDDYSITLEPACQFEISINPYSDIETIKSIYEDFVTLWTPGYKYMDSYFRHSGRYGKYMMRASASTQVSVDFRSEEDMVRKLNILQKISPVLMIAMENKTDPDSTLKEHPDKPHLFRIQEWDDLDPSRTGFYPHSLEEGFGYDSVADTILHTPLILLTDDGVTTDVGSETAEDLFARGLIREETLDITRERSLIEHFISMGFFHYRVKKYIEIRVADSVPLDRALGYVAILKGIVYSDDSLSALEKELADVDTAEKIQQAVEDIERDGYNAVVYGRKATEWAAHLYELALDKLPDTDKEYLENVRAFWGIS